MVIVYGFTNPLQYVNYGFCRVFGIFWGRYGHNYAYSLRLAVYILYIYMYNITIG